MVKSNYFLYRIFETSFCSMLIEHFHHFMRKIIISIQYDTRFKTQYISINILNKDILHHE